MHARARARRSRTRTHAHRLHKFLRSIRAENKGAAGTTAALPLFLRSPLERVELQKSGGVSPVSYF